MQRLIEQFGDQVKRIIITSNKNKIEILSLDNTYVNNSISNE